MNDITKTECVFEVITGEHLMHVHLHYMRYDCIALSLGCSGFTMTPHGFSSCVLAGFPGVVTR